MIRSLLFFVLLAAWARAIPVSPSIEHTLTDEFGRTIAAQIIGVTADAVEFTRAGDKARFSLPIKKLSDEDKVFFAELLKKTEESRPLPDTPWLVAVRRDFQVFNPGIKRLVPLDPNTYGGTRIFVIATTYLTDTSSPQKDGLNREPSMPDQAPVLWIYHRGERLLFEIIAEKLPPGHAMLSYEAREKAMQQGSPVYQAFTSAWFDQRRRDTPNGSMSFSPSDEERADLVKQLTQVMPIYWANIRATFYMMERGSSYPQCSAVRRDGTPVKFRGAPLTGSRQVVMKVLRDNAGELE